MSRSCGMARLWVTYLLAIMVITLVVRLAWVIYPVQVRARQRFWPLPMKSTWLEHGSWQRRRSSRFTIRQVRAPKLRASRKAPSGAFPH